MPERGGLDLGSGGVIHSLLLQSVGAEFRVLSEHGKVLGHMPVSRMNIRLAVILLFAGSFAIGFSPTPRPPVGDRPGRHRRSSHRAGPAGAVRPRGPGARHRCHDRGAGHPRWLAASGAIFGLTRGVFRRRFDGSGTGRSPRPRSPTRPCSRPRPRFSWRSLRGFGSASESPATSSSAWCSAWPARRCWRDRAFRRHPGI